MGKPTTVAELAKDPFYAAITADPLLLPFDQVQSCLETLLPADQYGNESKLRFFEAISRHPQYHLPFLETAINHSNGTSLVDAALDAITSASLDKLQAEQALLWLETHINLLWWVEGDSGWGKSDRFFDHTTPLTLTLVFDAVPGDSTAVVWQRLKIILLSTVLEGAFIARVDAATPDNLPFLTRLTQYLSRTTASTECEKQAYFFSSYAQQVGARNQSDDAA
ncbi:MAG: hypothetical protein RBJ76_13090 [Stenomitos frigidus ULC029]